MDTYGHQGISRLLGFYENKTYGKNSIFTCAEGQYSRPLQKWMTVAERTAQAVTTGCLGVEGVEGEGIAVCATHCVLASPSPVGTRGASVPRDILLYVSHLLCVSTRAMNYSV